MYTVYINYVKPSCFGELLKRQSTEKTFQGVLGLTKWVSYEDHNNETAAHSRHFKEKYEIKSNRNR